MCLNIYIYNGKLQSPSLRYRTSRLTPPTLFEITLSSLVRFVAQTELTGGGPIWSIYMREDSV